MYIKNGQFWLGDCLDLMGDIPDGSVDMVLTDPPYKMTKTGKSSRPNYMPNGFIIGDKIPDVEEWFDYLAEAEDAAEVAIQYAKEILLPWHTGLSTDERAAVEAKTDARMKTLTKGT